MWLFELFQVGLTADQTINLPAKEVQYCDKFAIFAIRI